MTSIEQMAMKAVKAKWAARKEAKAAAKADKADKAAAEPPVADDEPEEKADKSRMGAFIRRLEASILEERDGLDEEGPRGARDDEQKVRHGTPRQRP